MSMNKKTTLTIMLLLMALAIIPVMDAIDGGVCTMTIPVSASVCNGTGNSTDVFLEGEGIYVQADGGALSPNAWYLVWVQNCELSPGVLDPSEDPTGAIEFVHTNGNGSLNHTLIWENSTVGNYTAVLDGGELGNYNVTEKQCVFEVTWQ